MICSQSVIIYASQMTRTMHAFISNEDNQRSPHTELNINASTDLSCKTVMKYQTFAFPLAIC